MLCKTRICKKEVNVVIKNLFGKLIENRGKVWFAFLLNAVILSVLSMVFCAYYESSDDMGTTAPAALSARARRRRRRSGARPRR